MTRPNTGASGRKSPLWLSIIIALALIGIYVGAMIFLPLPKPVVAQIVKQGAVDTGQFVPIVWPKSQQAAMGMLDYPNIVTSYDNEKPLPIASIAKVVSALAILKQKPLELNQPGPTITLGSKDVDFYNSYKSKDGSVVAVQAGEKISQYQALQAMLLPSANNMAASMVTWAFGSEESYKEYANKMVADFGLEHTHIEDASGFSPKTVSTASDLVKLGKIALQCPVLAEIVAQTEANIPVAGNIKTTNDVMGKSGIIGIKTGHTPESGGCFLFAARQEVGGRQQVVIAAVIAAPTIQQARAGAPAVVNEGFDNITTVKTLGESAAVATVRVPWANPLQIVAKKDLTQTVWKGTDLSLKINITPGDTEQAVGLASMGNDSTELFMQQELPQPNIWWRLLHPVELMSALNS